MGGPHYENLPERHETYARKNLDAQLLDQYRTTR